MSLPRSFAKPEYGHQSRLANIRAQAVPSPSATATTTTTTTTTTVASTDSTECQIESPEVINQLYEEMLRYYRNLEAREALTPRSVSPITSPRLARQGSVSAIASRFGK